MPLYSFECRAPTVDPDSARPTRHRRGAGDRRARQGARGPIAGTGAEISVNTNPGANQDLARRYLTGLEFIE